LEAENIPGIMDILQDNRISHISHGPLRKQLFDTLAGCKDERSADFAQRARQFSDRGNAVAALASMGDPGKKAGTSLESLVAQSINDLASSDHDQGRSGLRQRSPFRAFDQSRGQKDRDAVRQNVALACVARSWYSKGVRRRRPCVQPVLCGRSAVS